MLKEFHLKNYQSHKDSVLRFSPGLNAIVGASDSGKSAIMRALMGTIFNTNCGMAEVSRWIKTPKKAIKKGEEMRLVLLNDDHRIERYRNTQNGYDLDGEALEAIGTSVPEKISKALNITDVNIHQQDDPYFLLSSSNGEVGRYVNKMVNLQEIDQFTSEMKSEVSSISAKIEENAAELKKQRDELETMEWVDEASAILAEIDALTESINADSDKMQTIETQLTVYEESAAEVARISKIIDGASKAIAEVKAIDVRISKIAANYASLCKSIRAYEEAQKDMATFSNLERVAQLLAEVAEIQSTMPNPKTLRELSISIESYQENIELSKKDLTGAAEAISRVKAIDVRVGNIRTGIKKIDDSLSEYEANSAILENSTKVIISLNAELNALKPLICPTCGQMRKDHEH